MVDLDLKDRKILYQLDLNCRQSNAQIGKKVGLSRKVVDYRIKRMEDEGIITGYYTAINTYKLGYYVFRIYLNLIDVSLEIKKDIINYFVNNKNAWAVITSRGPVELDIVLWVNDVYKFNKYWTNTLQNYGKYFTNHSISILTSTISCKKSYLNINDKDNRFFYKTNCKEKPLIIDKLDYQILDNLALNARMALIDLAKKLNISSQTVNYRIKNLMNNDIIQAFRISINPYKLGLNGCSVDLYLKDQTIKEKIIDYLIENPNIYDIMDMNIGWADIGFQLFINNINEVTKIIEDIETKFPNSIRRYDYWMEQFCHKERWLPEMEFK